MLSNDIERGSEVFSLVVRGQRTNKEISALIVDLRVTAVNTAIGPDTELTLIAETAGQVDMNAALHL